MINLDSLEHTICHDRNITDDEALTLIKNLRLAVEALEHCKTVSSSTANVECINGRMMIREVNEESGDALTTIKSEIAFEKGEE